MWVLYTGGLPVQVVMVLLGLMSLGDGTIWLVDGGTGQLVPLLSRLGTVVVVLHNIGVVVMPSNTCGFQSQLGLRLIMVLVMPCNTGC
jgi:hypothetical protein